MPASLLVTPLSGLAKGQVDLGISTPAESFATGDVGRLFEPLLSFAICCVSLRCSSRLAFASFFRAASLLRASFFRKKNPAGSAGVPPRPPPPRSSAATAPCPPFLRLGGGGHHAGCRRARCRRAAPHRVFTSDVFAGGGEGFGGKIV